MRYLPCRDWADIASAVVIVTLLVAPGHAIVTSDEHGSHVVAPGESTFGLELSGVVMIGGMKSVDYPVATCSGSLIGDRYVLSAAHCFDTDGNGEVDRELGLFPHQVVFEATSGYEAITYELDSIQWLPEWPDHRGDLAIIALVEEAPSWAKRYPLYADDAEVGKPIVLAGYGFAGHGSTGEEAFAEDLPTKRAGRNRYDAIRDDYEGVDFLASDFDSGLEENNSLALADFVSDLGFGGDEANSASGDSGGPAFINGAIAGVTAFGNYLPGADVTDALDSSWGEASFDTRVSLFKDFILEATDGQALFVVDGDYTKDGMVDGSDFLLWQRQYGEADFPTSDGDGDGMIDAADLALWEDNFGRSTAPPATIAVPEPPTAILLIGCFFVLRLAHRRRVSHV